MDNFSQLSLNLAYLGLLVSFILAFLRLIVGPTLADRVVSLDLIASITIGFLAVYTLDSGQEVLLDIAITLALVAFLGTIAFARYISNHQDKEEDGV